jgi:DNA mismatch repair ATPase MutS
MIKFNQMEYITELDDNFNINNNSSNRSSNNNNSSNNTNKNIKNKKITFTHRVVEGKASQSFSLFCARIANLEEDVIERAEVVCNQSFAIYLLIYLFIYLSNVFLFSYYS